MNSETVLRALLRREPRLTLEQIRSAHPIFQTRSIDHLSVRIARALESDRELRAT